MEKLKKNCQICGEEFSTKSETATLCSHDCFLVWIETEEFDNELCKVLGISKENKNEKGNNI